MLSRLIVAVITACFLSACATPTTRLVNQAAKSGTQTEAFPKLLALANQGDAEAQWAVGYYYVKGSGTDQDYDRAFDWLTKSAKGDHHGRMNWLAQCYLNGWGTPKNPKEAIYWYEKAAAKGNSGALKTLGDAYFYGYHYQKNYPRALNYYTREKYKGTVDSFGNVDLHPQYDPGTKYKGSVDSDGTGRVRSWSGDELTIKPR